MIIPKHSWGDLTGGLLAVRSGALINSLPESLRDELREFGYIHRSGLTVTGNDLAVQKFVRADEEAVRDIHCHALMNLAATQAVLQAIWGLSNISVDQVRTALIFAGADEVNLKSNLVSFLSMLNTFQIITYSRKFRTVVPLTPPANQDEVPAHVFIDPKRPYSNNFWIRQIISECRGGMIWIDKYFDKSAFEWIWRQANAENITQIDIISVRPSDGIDTTTESDYRKLVKELMHRGIALEWRLVDKSKSHLVHDRWIIDSTDICYNLPSTSTIRSGQASELLRSSSHADVAKLANVLKTDSTLL